MTPLSPGEYIIRRPTARHLPRHTTSWPQTCFAWLDSQHGDWRLRQSPRLLLSDHYMDRREPPVGIFAGTVDHPEEFLLQPLRDRTAPPGADCDPVDGADRRDFGGRAAEENLVRDVQHFAGNDGLHHGDADLAGQRQDGVARDAGQYAGA